MVSVKDVYYCREGAEPIAVVVDKGPVVCQDCGKDMLNIGWFETDGKDKGTEEQEDRSGDE